jgi:hypothetical protein
MGMAKQVELLPCPFCGSPASQPDCLKSGGSRPVWEISCPMFCVGMRRRSKQEVVKCWNQRAGQTK